MTLVFTAENRRPIKAWLKSPADIEEGALEQAEALASLPFVFKHVALMPDVHSGYGMPIGGVVALDGMISPNMVGVDIGCGMAATKLNLNMKEVSTEVLKKIIGEMRTRIPVGFNCHATPDNIGWKWLMEDVMGSASFRQDEVIDRCAEKAKTQIGTLGGGNHFIEIQHDEEGSLWLMLHSGSRNLGKQVADHYNKLAQDMCQRWGIVLPNKDLAYLPLESAEGAAYHSAMTFCLEYAALNRRTMMDAAFQSVEKFLPGLAAEESVNIHHNYAALENHFGRNVVVHRKGATCVREGTVGIIPGSMGASSYIVKGKGNPDSFHSCSHGAGRQMGRKQAQRSLDLEAELTKMEGIVHGIRHKDDLEEAPGAYKPIEEVMLNQMDLVSILATLRPLANLKG